MRPSLGRGKSETLGNSKVAESADTALTEPNSGGAGPPPALTNTPFNDDVQGRCMYKGGVGLRNLWRPTYPAWDLGKGKVTRQNERSTQSILLRHDVLGRADRKISSQKESLRQEQPSAATLAKKSNVPMREGQVGNLGEKSAIVYATEGGEWKTPKL